MISKEDFIVELAKEAGVSESDTSRIYDALIAFVASGLKTSPIVVLPGLPPMGADYSNSKQSSQDEQARRLLDALGSKIFSSLR